MDPKTEVLRDIKGAENLSACDVPMTLGRSDIVAGNRYRGDEKEPFLLVPDPEGPWLALVTHRAVEANIDPATIGPDGKSVLPGWRNPEWKRLDVRDATTLPRHHRVMLDRLRAAGWIVTDSENIDVAESGMATRGDTRILITPDSIRVVPQAPRKDGHVGVSLDHACEQATAVLEAADIIDAVRTEWRRASEWGAVHPVTTEPTRRIIPVDGFHDMEHLLEDAEPAGIVPRPSR